jgi:hypothetical protein
MFFRPPLPCDELLHFYVQPAGSGNLSRMFHLDKLSPVFPELSDKHQTVREVSPNPPAREPRGLGKAGQLRARETFEDRAPELRADQPLPGEAPEHTDGEVGEPVALDIGDDHRPLGDPRKPGEELSGLIEGEIVQHHGRQHEVEAVRAERQVIRVAAHVLDSRVAARARRRAFYRLGVSIDRDDLQWMACFAAPLRQPPRNVTAAAAHIQHPDLARRNTRNQRGHAHDNASSAAAEAVGGGQLV